MKYAVDVHTFGDFADTRVLAELAATAEANGWDGFFIWDHIGLEQPTADVTVALTAIALATERIRFGAMVTPLPRRRPHKFAREIASLDQLSGGRVIVGVGLGWPPAEEYEAFGEDGSDRVRAERLDESLAVVDALWRGERVDLDGRHLRMHAPAFAPRPVQQPRPPIWVAGTWPGTLAPFRRAARWDGVYPMHVNPAERFYLLPDEIRALRDTIGRDDAAFDIAVSPPPGSDADAYEAAGATWWLAVCADRAEAFARAAAGPR
jgi:alkanesulfonate monooxygenase SsuD/methylene tetrahydromethanopterin reductase-like flavin-dependent oxidoreductase (luciferase family)